MNMLQENPDLRTVRPRPGGSIKIFESEEVQEVHGIPPFSKVIEEEGEEKIDGIDTRLPRRERLKQALSKSPWSYVGANELDKEPKPSSVQNTIELLSITISTIMLLASQPSDVPRPYLEWSYTYLDLVKDEFGHTPPNIQGIMNQMQNVAGNNLKSLIKDDEAGEEEDEGNEEGGPEEEDV